MELTKDFAIKNYRRGFLVYLKDTKKMEGLERVDLREDASCLSLSHSSVIRLFMSNGGRTVLISIHLLRLNHL